MLALALSLLTAFGILCVIALAWTAEKRRSGCALALAAVLLFWVAALYYTIKHFT